MGINYNSTCSHRITLALKCVYVDSDIAKTLIVKYKKDVTGPIFMTLLVKEYFARWEKLETA